MSLPRINRFTGTMLAMALLAACIGGALFFDLYRTQQDSRQSYTEAVRGLDLIGELQYHAQEARRTLLYALATTDSNLQVDYADQSRAAESDFALDLAEYRRLANAKQEIAVAEKISADWASYLAVRDDLIALMLEGDPKAAIERDLLEGVPVFNTIRADLDTTKQLLKANAGKLLAEVDASFQQSLLRMAAILGTLAVLGTVSVKTAQGRTLVRELQASEARLREDFDKAQREERATAERLAAVLRAATEYSIIGTTPEGIITVFNHGATLMLGYRPEEVVGKLTPETMHDSGEVARRAKALGMEPGFEVFVAAARRGEAETREWTYVRKDGRCIPVSLTVTAMSDSTGVLAGFIGIATDIGARKRADVEMRQLNERLVDASRQAGMAEVATGVLHNVGNVLNSVNVSANVIGDTVRASRIAGLGEVAALLRSQNGSLAEFLTTDPRGRLVPELLGRLADGLRAEHATLATETTTLVSHVGHIRDIVAMQQSLATVSGVSEKLAVSSLVEDALKLQASSLSRHDVELVREFADVPPAIVDRHKTLQILVNLIRNAKQAMSENRGRPSRLTLCIAPGEPGRVRIVVRDSGGGIAQENLTRVFGHGFTTKKEGHGFGLHSSANAASEMGGSLTAHSDGPGTGATFTLELPLAETEPA